MKKIATLLLIMAWLTVAGTATAQSRHATDQFEVTPFDAIESSVVANIIIRQSDITKVTAEGSEKLLDRLEVRMDGKTLILEMDTEDMKEKKINGNKDKLTIVISTPTLTQFESEGVGNIEFDGTFKTPELVIESEGVGNLRADNLIAGSVILRYEGVGNITLGGKSDKIDIRSEAVGNIDAAKLVAKNTIVSLEGVGHVKCHATDYLEVHSNGIGGVKYYGNPKKKELHKNGIGRIKSGD